LDILDRMQELLTTSDVIDELGGNSAVSALTGSKPKAVSMWRTAGRFPWKTEMPIIEALRDRNKTAPRSLWGMKAPERAA
jgi:hypothetical protein